MTTTTFPKEKIKILLLEGVHPSAVEAFIQAGYSQMEEHKGAWTEEELLAKISDVHILGIRSKTQLSAAVLSKAQRLLAVGCFCIGVNQVDMLSATEKGIAVFNSPFSNTRSVAELVIAHAIMLMRRVFEKNEAAHEGRWLKDSADCYEVRGKTMGIIGYGHIGSQVSVMAEGLGMKVMYYDIEPKLALGNAQAASGLNDLLAQADIVSLHVPSTPTTHGMIGQQQLDLMKKGAVLINLSRGDVMDINAVCQSLQAKKIGGAAVDVFPVEPESKGDLFSSPLQKMTNVALTPHIGGSTIEAQLNIGIDVAYKLINYLDKGSTVGSLSVPALNLPIQENTYRILHIHQNQPGVLSELNTILGNIGVNIVGQYLQTNSQIGYVVVDTNKEAATEVMSALKKVKHTIKVRSLY